MAEQNAKIKKASENYDYKHNSIAQMEADKHADYANTSNNHKAIAAEKNRQKEIREDKIRQLEVIEQQLVGNLQTTLARKDQAISNLKSKSKMVAKALEPRNAYRYSPKENNNTVNQTFNGSQSFQSLDSTVRKVPSMKGFQSEKKSKIKADPNLVLLN